jgi:hypothetical protein
LDCSAEMALMATRAVESTGSSGMEKKCAGDRLDTKDTGFV